MTTPEVPVFDITTHLLEGYTEEWWEGRINGRSYYGLRKNTEAEARAAAERAVQRIRDDIAITPALNTYFGRPRYEDVLDRTCPVEVGFRVVVHSRGYLRRAIVEKVGRKNIVAVYVTERNGNITRKSVPIDKVYMEAFS